MTTEELQVLASVFNNISMLNGVEYHDGDLCISEKYFDCYMIAYVIKGMIERGNLSITINDNDEKAGYLRILIDACNTCTNDIQIEKG